MIKDILTADDCDNILESLKYSKLKFEEYNYPTYEYKQKKIVEVNQLILKIKSLKKLLLNL